MDDKWIVIDGFSDVVVQFNDRKSLQPVEVLFYNRPV